MDRIFALLRVLIFLPTCTCVNPGLKIRITQNGLNYGMYPYCTQWRIQDFPQGGAPTPKIAIIFHIFAENCMKMKEFGPPGGGARVPGAPLGSANGTNKINSKITVCVKRGTQVGIQNVLTTVTRG